MQSFISQVVSEIQSKHQSFEDVVIVLPSQRAGVFMREECKRQIHVGFLPVISSIEEFVTEVSGFQKIETLPLLFLFYEMYKKLDSDPQTFDVFSNWAMVAIQDFNEVDQYLIDSKDLFHYIRDIKRLQKWSLEDQIEETEMMSAHYSFIEQLGILYEALTNQLIQEKRGYQGLVFKQALEHIDNFLDKRKETAFYFVGFNALTTSEELLIQRVLQHPHSDIYWDIDRTFLNSNHQAGHFLRTYVQNWHYFEKNDIKHISDHFSSSKNIQVIGATKNVTQIKEVGNLLESIQDYTKTALVLGDESLLPVMLNSIPKKVPSINITMGYSLKDIPAFQLIRDYFDLHLTSEKLMSGKGGFYYKSLLNLLGNSLLKSVFSDTDKETSSKLAEEIVQNNLSFTSLDFLADRFEHEAIQHLFQKNSKVNDLIDRMIAFIEYAKDLVSDLEKEYLFRFFNAFQQLKYLNEQYNYFTDLKTLYRFFKQIIANETLSFQGEPLNGLQCMGVLETRVLDFENIIITSMNEGLIPNNNQQNSFIPFDVKVHFGLPTYKEKDGIFSYHIFRLLQRAKNIYLFYNTESDDYGNGEQSRFISQLDLLKKDIHYKTISPKVSTEKVEPIVVYKTPEVIQKLKERAVKGFSPSAIGSYLYDPIQFYKQKVLGLDESEEVEETLATNTMGNIVHKVLEELYLPYLNQYLTVDHLEAMEKVYRSIIDEVFPRYFKKGNFETGKNKLLYEIVVSYIQRFLASEKKLVSIHTLKVLEVEKQLEAEFIAEGIDFPIRLYGEIDRIDELDGTLRIKDYKTGVVTPSHMKIPTDWNLNDEKHSKAIQVLIYSFMYLQNHPEAEAIIAGNLSFKKLGSGFLPLTFPNTKEHKHLVTQEQLLHFQQSLGVIFRELFDKDVPFVERER